MTDTVATSWPALADALDVIATTWLADGTPADHAAAVLPAAVHLVPGADHASVLRATRHAQPVTLAASDAAAARLDQIQLQLREGPALDAIAGSRQHLVAHTPDLTADPRWPALADVEGQLGAHTVTSVGLPLPAGQAAALTVSASRRDAFPETTIAIVRVVAAQLGLGLAAQLGQEQAEQMREALESNRQIGAAVGILMTRRLCTSEQALRMLRGASERSHRKLREVAAEVLLTGDLPELSG